MGLLIAAKPWTYWIAPVLFLVGALALVGVLVGYFVRVVSARYPRQ